MQDVPFRMTLSFNKTSTSVATGLFLACIQTFPFPLENNREERTNYKRCARSRSSLRVAKGYFLQDLCGLRSSVKMSMNNML